MQKLYCYVDETGQDTSSEFFIVVAVVNEGDQNNRRGKLLEVEKLAKTGRLKWHKSRHDRRIKYLRIILENDISFGDVYYGKYKKPLPYFFPILETLKRAITSKSSGNYHTVVFIDGIDRKKAAEFTNALRLGGVRLELVRSRRDESEPLIRLADMWAGCIRDACSNRRESKELFDRAIKSGYLIEVTK